MPFDQAGWLRGALQIPSPNQDCRPIENEATLVVVHSISLPPGDYFGPGISALFTNSIDPDRHPYFQTLVSLRVSAHVMIRRDGGLVQYVPFSARAWHAGVSSWQGRERCNDFSIGIELEGTDGASFSDAQYLSLDRLVKSLMMHYSIAAVVGHSDVAPGRKTDPGPFFDWLRLSFRCNSDEKNAQQNL
jgi:AmpD protein